ncbi:MAG: gliding motility lipoprotein GldD [Prolixibacteraceae bacterium]|nr:gliding motility lipoprotein GldD [Prolixibacteraceae bacterium]
MIQKTKMLFFSLLVGLILTGGFSCRKEYVPKPRGYFRIEFQEKSYQLAYSSAFPYRFEIPVYSQITPDEDKRAEPYWVNLKVPAHKAELHISFKAVNHNLARLTEDSRSLAYKHSIKADAINERVFVNPEKRVFGTIYLIDGNAASPLQFYLTDSTRNFLRGALYIREVPNIDSIRPVIDFLTTDVIHLIETTEWVR